MKKTLKEIYGIREMSITVPDDQVDGLRKSIIAGVKHKFLPPEAKQWISSQGAEQPKAQDKKNQGLDDPWFQDDAEDSGPVTPPPVQTKKPAASAPPAAKPGQAASAKKPPPPPDYRYFDAEADSDGDMPAPSLKQKQAGTGDDDIDVSKPLFPHGSFGSNGSSWDDVDAWQRDQEYMPRAGGGSKKTIPASYEDEDDDFFAVPGKIPKKSKSKNKTGLDPTKTWTDKDVKKLEPKKPGMLSRIFGSKQKSVPDEPTDDIGQKIRKKK